MFVRRFPSTRRGARLARRIARYRLDLWGVPYGCPASDAVALVVAELAANSVLHGRVPGRDFELRLTYDHAADVVRVEVSDTHPGHPRHPESSEPMTEGPAEAEGGRGLLIVEAVAARWGVEERTGPGKTVWAECALRTSPARTPTRTDVPTRTPTRPHDPGGEGGAGGGAARTPTRPDDPARPVPSARFGRS